MTVHKANRALDGGGVMRLRVSSTSGKVLLVCAAACGGAEKLVSAAGYQVAKVTSGEKAIHRVQRETFDAAILISTGKSMDITETVLNLRDLDESMHIAVIAEGEGVRQNSVVQELLSGRFPPTRILTMDELEEYLGSLTSPKQLTSPV